MRARRALLPLTPCRAPPSATTTLVCRLSSCSTSSSTPSSSEPRFPPWSAVSHPSVLSPPFVFHARRSCRPCWPSPAAVCWSPCPSPSTVHGSCSLPRPEGGSVRRSRPLPRRAGRTTAGVRTPWTPQRETVRGTAAEGGTGDGGQRPPRPSFAPNRWDGRGARPGVAAVRHRETARGTAAAGGTVDGGRGTTSATAVVRLQPL